MGVDRLSSSLNNRFMPSRSSLARNGSKTDLDFIRLPSNGGLAGAAQRVQLSYAITDRLEWQVESGQGTDTDLFYTIERQPRAQRRGRE